MEEFIYSENIEEQNEVAIPANENDTSEEDFSHESSECYCPADDEPEPSTDVNDNHYEPLTDEPPYSAEDGMPCIDDPSYVHYDPEGCPVDPEIWTGDDPLIWDEPEDPIATHGYEFFEEDRNGDGQIDAVHIFKDTDGDGVADTMVSYLDEDFNGSFETTRIIEDTNKDGKIDSAYEGVDVDGDGKDDVAERWVDTNGDGVLDSWRREIDLDGDGKNEMVEERHGDTYTLEQDTDGDGRVDFWYKGTDVDGDGKDDFVEIRVDSNNSGLPDTYVQQMDTDGDGVIDVVVRGSDYNDDGMFDSLRIYEDTDGNGTFDTLTEIYDSDHDGQLDTAKIYYDYDGDGRDDWTQVCRYDPASGTVTPLNDPPQYTEGIAGTTYEELTQFEPSPNYPEGITGDPSSSMKHWEFQGNTNRCALFSQKFVVEEFTGEDISIDEFVSVAENNGWFSEDGGTTFLNINKMLDYYGIDNEMSFHNSIEDIDNCLSEGGRVIVAIDADEIWYGQGGDLFSPTSTANHAVEVIGIDYSDPEHPMVILNDSGTPNGKGAMIPLDDFMDAWKDSECQMIACYPNK